MPMPLTPEALLADRRWIEDLARRLVRHADAAEDVAQETWRRVLERPPELVSSPRGWLHSVVKSCARERWRSDARREARERAVSRPEATPGAAQLVARADAQRTVLDAVMSLDPASREVVLLRYFEDLEPWEIARRVGAPQGTVRSRLHRALAVLRKRLDDEYGGDSAAWGVALLGPAIRTAARAGGESTFSKGVLVMTMQMKTTLGALALLAIFLVWWRADGAPAAPKPPEPKPGDSVAPAPRASSFGRAPAADETATTAETAPFAASAPASPVASGPKRLPVRVLELTPADATPDAGGGAIGMSGEITDDGPAEGGVMLGGGIAIEADGWTKWKPVPEKGTAALRGKVVDSTGAPLPGAEILRVQSAAGGGEGDVRDFRHITTIGMSAADGTFSLESQPARAYRLAANWHSAMSGIL